MARALPQTRGTRVASLEERPSQSPNPKSCLPQRERECAIVAAGLTSGIVCFSLHSRPRDRALSSLRPVIRSHTHEATMQAVTPSLRALQASLLNRVRVPVLGTSGWGNARSMSEEAHAHGTYLDRREVIDRVLSVVKSSQKVDASKVSETATFKDMGLDSLDEVEVVMALEEEFALEIPDAEADKIRSATDAIDYIASHPRAK